eukprot:1159870-Pelagomonas_calceolata.AAC.16
MHYIIASQKAQSAPVAGSLLQCSCKTACAATQMGHSRAAIQHVFLRQSQHLALCFSPGWMHACEKGCDPNRIEITRKQRTPAIQTHLHTIIHHTHNVRGGQMRPKLGIHIFSYDVDRICAVFWTFLKLDSHTQPVLQLSCSINI